MKVEKTANITRKSGIELLKILALFLIMIGHVSQSAGQNPTELPQFASKLINSKMATSNIQYIVIAFFRHFGALGNNIFFMCSFWFLCESNKINVKKIFIMLMDVWVISIIYLLIYLPLEPVSLKMIVTCIFPTLFGNNWFVTCYILIYLIHPFLNLIMERISQKTYVMICIISIFLYCGVAYVQRDLLFHSSIIHCIVLYFIMGYIKKYMCNWSNDIKKNAFMLWCGIIGTVGVLITINTLGLYIPLLENLVLRWASDNSPFIIITALALFNIFRQFYFESMCINFLSGLSMILYLVHENVLFRNFTRVRVWVMIFEKYGYDYIVLHVLIYSIVLFLVAYIISIIYKVTIHKFIVWAEKYVEKFILKLLSWLSEVIMKIT